MATLFPTLERENTQENVEQESSLKAYGKLSGREESAVLTEDEIAMRFNSRISDNYQKLINPEYKKEEAYAEPENAYAREQVFEPVFEHQRVTEDIFRADSVYNSPRKSFTEIPVDTAAVYEEPAYATEAYAQPSEYEAENIAEADLMPTATTIQYQNNLYKEERKANVESKKSYSMTTKGKVLMLVYSLVVVVILALIIINTSVLKTLDGSVAEKREALNKVRAEYTQVQEQIEELTSEQSIIERAEKELGMVMGD